MSERSSIGRLPLAPLRRRRLAGVDDKTRAARDAEDRLLIKRCQEDPDERVRAQTVTAYMPLAHSLARRYHRGEEPLEDLEQVAALGLLKAIKGFNPDRGSAFASYAVPTITGELRRHFRDKGWTIRVPRGLQELALAVQRQTKELSTGLGREPTVAELSAALSRSGEDILEARQALHAMRPASLDRPSSDGDQDDAPLNRIGGVDPGFQQRDAAVLVDSLLAKLPERERQLIVLRFGGDLTQTEIAGRLGLSQMHVSRLLIRSLAELEQHATAGI
jgi:RNA polymerase sigma-B factor